MVLFLKVFHLLSKVLSFKIGIEPLLIIKLFIVFYFDFFELVLEFDIFLAKFANLNFHLLHIF